MTNKLGIILSVAVFILVLVIVPAAAGQKSGANMTVPKYDPTTEATFKGTVEGVKDRICP